MSLQCKACQGTAKKIFDVKDINQKTSDIVFHYYECMSCKLVFLQNIPIDLSKYYGTNYSAYTREGNVYTSPSEYDLGKIKLAKEFISGQNLLEIGPGNGAFANLAINHGYRVDVIEMDKNCCEFLRANLKIGDVHNSENILATLEQISARYDAIVMWHVIEHLTESERLIEALSQRLNPNGVLIIAAPNPQSLQFKIFGKYWKHLDAPRHLVLIPIKLLRKFGLKSGLSVVKYLTNDPVNKIFNSYGWWIESVKNTSHKKNSILLEVFLKYPRLSRLFFMIGISWFQKINGFGNGYTVVLKKQMK